MSDESGRHPMRVCLGFPPFAQEKYLERLAALGGVEASVLPIDPEADWATEPAGHPHTEPPSWATSVAAEREAVLAQAHVLTTLHTPDRLSERAPNLRWIQGAGAGVEQFSTAGVAQDRVVLTNCSGVSAGSMSEWVIGRLLQVWKRFREADEFQQGHRFERSYGRTFSGSTIGIVGLGGIGKAVASRARALGCRTLGLKRSARPGDSAEEVDELFSTDRLHELLAQSDAVIVAAPATAETHHLIDAAALAAMPRHAILVNVARGTLVDETELVRVMREEPLAAAVLDVFDPEPLDPSSPLWDIPNVYVSAHSSVAVDRYMDDVFELFYDNLQRFLRGEALRNIVDMKSLGFE
ncbi:MAG: D-2-hydroxyacid dehydrogenase [bacterium]|nr:oxidoreductase [Deltaproteobacteria bacterium]MCP4908285.1 D-2-hydroxyacid dehydrogenase [bacterium]